MSKKWRRRRQSTERRMIARNENMMRAHGVAWRWRKAISAAALAAAYGEASLGGEKLAIA
jgi:hypothetical protein